MVVRRPAFNDVIVLRQRESHKDTKDTERIGKGCGNCRCILCAFVTELSCTSRIVPRIFRESRNRSIYDKNSSNRNRRADHRL